MQKQSIVAFFVIGIVLLMGGQAQAQGTICSEVTTISTTECEALVSFYESTTETEWHQRTNWLINDDPCEWYGVSCREGHVTVLALSRNNLSGVIPAAVGELSHLQLFDVAENNLSGALPAEMTTLSHLERLYLNDNPLSGELPTTMAGLSRLNTLWLYHTNLCDPTEAWFSTLADGQYSGVACDNDTLITTASLTMAQPVELLCANVTEISEAECMALVMLYQNTNGAEWSDNTAWTDMEMICEWYGVTCEDGHVTALALADNNLNGSLPPQLGDLGQLTQLDVGGNELSGPLPGSLTKLDLESLNVADTGLCQPKNALFGEWLTALALETPIASCGAATVSESTPMTTTEMISGSMVMTNSESSTMTMAEMMTAKEDDSSEATEPLDSSETAESTEAAAFAPPSAETAAMPQSGAVLSANSDTALLIVGFGLISLLMVGAVIMSRRD